MSEIQIRSTGTTEVIQSSDGRITLSVPIQIKRRSGRKQMTLPNGQSGQPGKLLRPWDVAATPLQLALAATDWALHLATQPAQTSRLVSEALGMATHSARAALTLPLKSGVLSPC